MIMIIIIRIMLIMVIIMIIIIIDNDMFETAFVPLRSLAAKATTAFLFNLSNTAPTNIAKDVDE